MTWKRMKTAAAAVAAVAAVTLFMKPGAAPAKETGTFRIPLSFEPNMGQGGDGVSFLARGGHALRITKGSAVLGLPGQEGTIRMTWLGGNPNAAAKGLEPLESKSHYIIGSDPAKWRTAVPNFAKVRVEQVYPGIGLVSHPSADRLLEYDFEVGPGADPSMITLAFEGVRKLSIDGMSGDLLIETGRGVVKQRKPVAYQGEGPSRREVTAAYSLDGGRVRIDIGEYDRSRLLVVDPIIDFSTYFGGSNDDAIRGHDRGHFRRHLRGRHHEERGNAGGGRSLPAEPQRPQ